MGSAILKGILSKKIAGSKQIIIFDSDKSKISSVSKKFSVRRAAGNKDLVEQADIVVLAVKPQEFKTVADQIRSQLNSNQVVISILAGTPVAKIKKYLIRGRIVRAMPNLGAQVAEGITAITSSDRQALKISEIIFSGCGKVIRLNERHFDLVTAVSGSGLAYFFLLMELLARVANQNGLSKQEANLLAIQTAVGAAQLAQNSSYDPETLRKMVTSKKGTTDAALRHLEKKGFSKIFIEAIHQAMKRSKQLSKM